MTPPALLSLIFMLFLGHTMGSTHVESQLRDPTGASKKVQYSTARDMQPRRRMDTDQTVFKVYKGVKTFDFCKEKNVIVTGGKIILFLIFLTLRIRLGEKSIVDLMRNLCNVEFCRKELATFNSMYLSNWYPPPHAHPLELFCPNTRM